MSEVRSQETPQGGGSTIIRRWDSLEKWVAGILMIFALCLSFYSVIARYIFHWSLDWSDEISVYAVIWAVFFGISALIKVDEHVRVDLLINKFSPKRQNILHFYHTLLGLAFICVVAWGGYLMVQKAYQTGITSESYLKFKMYLPYLVMPFGGLLLVFRMVERLLMLGKQLKGQGAWKDPAVLGLIALSLALAYMLTTSDQHHRGPARYARCYALSRHADRLRHGHRLSGLPSLL